MSDDITPPRGFTPPVPPQPAPSRAAQTDGEHWLYGSDVKAASRGIDTSGQPTVQETPIAQQSVDMFPMDIFRPAKVVPVPPIPEQSDWDVPALPWEGPDDGSDDQMVDETAGEPPEATPPTERPPRRAFAAVIVAFVLLALVVGGAYFAIRAGQAVNPFNPLPTPTPVDDGSTPTRTVQVGSCFELSKTADSNYGSIWVVDCTQPHDAEVFLNQTITEDSYPTAAAWDALEASDCGPAFQTYVGSEMVSSSLKTQYIKPTSDAWDAGNKQLICFALDPSGDRQTSVANSDE